MKYGNNVISNRNIKSAFTIVELLVGIAVIGILAAISVVSYASWQNYISIDVIKSDANNMAAAMENSRNFGTSG
jgi:prepilin-type N-terminal cleavage/methylation domain-containing protein